ncbi:MAG: AAA family ATPase, partial [Acidimicrobiia bacterium]
MTLASHPTVIGLTGPFGAGCSTAALHLKAKRDYLVVRLSTPIRDEWKKKHPRKEASREELQRLGDDMRIEGGNAALVDLALEAAKKQSASEEVERDRLVIDGIRNTGEIDRLRERFGHRFTLFALLAQQPERWDRIESVYLEEGRSREEFLLDDQRDRNEEVGWGQQVELCIDMADVIIDNSADITLGKFKPKVIEFADLASGETARYPTQNEILMNMAYSSRHSSKCLKRHVGAVLVDQAGQAIGVGYNENPLGTNPCVEEPKYNHTCYRDIVRNEHFQLLGDEGARCPVCGNRLERIEGPPWRCPSCAKKGVKTNLETYFFPDRAM